MLFPQMFKPEITYLTGDLDTHMKNGFEKGKDDWKKTKEGSLIQEEVDMGASAAYTAIKKYFGILNNLDKLF